MDTTSCLHVPEIGLVVAGDAVYNDVHLHLSESDHKGRLDWLAALRTIESLHPKAVVAGHKRATRDDDPRIIGETRPLCSPAACGTKSPPPAPQHPRPQAVRRPAPAAEATGTEPGGTPTEANQHDDRTD
ncbi:MAG TPA: hypothetical protein VIY52_19890 [Streptosporangiaceae bacterium]